MHDDLPALADGDGVSVHSGFPNPALDHRGGSTPLALDLNRLLIERPSSTYLFRVSGHQWADQGVYDGDVAVIDRALQARPTDLIISWRQDGSTLSRQHQLTPDDQPWGVVTAIIHQYRP
jgi:DNA polymerase V